MTTICSPFRIVAGIRARHVRLFGGLRVRNSLNNTESVDVPPWAEKSFITWYACGPTVYDSTHLGHARTYVCFDIIRRILARWFNKHIVMCMGVTDIDDKIINRARERDMSPLELSAQYEQQFFEDMQTLNVLMPSARARVSDHIGVIVQYIATIQSNGFAYQADDGIYFNTKAFEASVGVYGKMAPAFARDSELAIANVEALRKEQLTSADRKRDPRDFALWKFAKDVDFSWDSPWGPGRPGWHIECSAMSNKVLGEHFDIHSGQYVLKLPL